MRETMNVDACYVIFTLCKLSLSTADSGNIVPLVDEVVVGVVGTLRHWSINQGCAENWAPIVDIPNFGSFLSKNWVGVGLWVSIYQNWGQITPILPQFHPQIVVKLWFNWCCGWGWGLFFTY